MVIDRNEESNLLKFSVTGECLAIKLEGDLHSWTKYFEQIQFWSELNFSIPHPGTEVQSPGLPAVS